jgi:hypothetical protein
MIMVGLLTSQQAQSLRGLQYAPDSYFNPIQDAEGNWVISLEEIEQSDIDWIKQVPLIEYKPIEFEICPTAAL